MSDDILEIAEKLVSLDTKARTNMPSVTDEEWMDLSCGHLRWKELAYALVQTNMWLDDAITELKYITNLNGISDIDTPYAQGFRRGRENTTSEARDFLDHLMRLKTQKKEGGYLPYLGKAKPPVRILPTNVIENSPVV